MRSLFWGILVFLSCIATARMQFNDAFEVVEYLNHPPQGWTRLGRADPNAQLCLRIALHMPDHELFEQTLFSISSPDHPEYGKYLNREEVKALIKPRDASTNAVLAWLAESKILSADIENDGEWINFKVTVMKAEQMMGTTFHYYARADDKFGSIFMRTLQYSVPRSVIPHIAMIQPTTRFAQLRPHRNSILKTEYFGKAGGGLTAASNPNTNASVACEQGVTPSCLRTLYNIGDHYADPNVGSLFGVCGYLREYAKYNALESFLQTYTPYAVSQNFTYQLINGGLSSQEDTVDDDVEANLDIQYAASLGYNQNITFYSTGGLGFLVPDLDQPTPASDENEPYLDFLDYILKLPDQDLPQTLSSSYGEDEQSVPEAYSKTVCNMFGQLGLRGVSVIFSSGDSGPGSACQTNDGKNITRFNPTFPGACPYVTSVGGTSSVEPETAVSFSSGGFSDRFRKPSYQHAAVDEYLDQLGDTWKGLFNPHGRGFPDVAAQSAAFHIIDQAPLSATGPGLADFLVGGTSCSAPTFASIISLLNNARLAAGKKPLGFLNPWLYSQGKDGLTDITSGGSKGCFGVDMYSGLPAPYVPGAGWNATKGWDPVTGLGTPDFGKLLALSNEG